MPTKLSIYNGALRFLGERKLSSLTENREPRRVLDDVWDDDGVKSCLQQGQWNFAIRSAQFDYDSGIQPPFGYRRVFGKPSDFVRTAGVCQDERFKVPLIRYQDNSGYWLADLDTIWVRYVSYDTDYGRDYSKWPPNFTRYVEGWFALQIAPTIKNSEVAKSFTKSIVDGLLKDAKATDSQEEPPGIQPSGSWGNARHRGVYRRDRPGSTLY